MKLTPILLCLLLPAIPAAAADKDDASVRTACTGIANEYKLVDSADACVKRAAAGDARTEALLSVYFMGHQDFASALLWYNRSAKQGDPVAQDGLGYLYLSGQGVKKDEKLANIYFRKSAEQGYADGQFYLGKSLLNARQYKEGAYWSEKAARQGNVDAQFNMALLYKDGLGVKQDVGYMYFWFNVAARNGNEKSQMVMKKMDTMLDENARAELANFMQAQLKLCPDCINGS